MTVFYAGCEESDNPKRTCYMKRWTERGQYNVTVVIEKGQDNVAVIAVKE